MFPPSHTSLTTIQDRINANMASPRDFVSLMGVTLVMDNILDQRKLTSEGLKAAITFVRLCDLAKHHLPTGTSTPIPQQGLANSIIDDDPKLSFITTSRMMFDLCRVEELASIFVRHVLRIQRRLADQATTWIGDREPMWLPSFFEATLSHRNLKSKEVESLAANARRTLIAAVGGERRPLSASEVARLERAFIRAEILFFLQAVFPVDEIEEYSCLTTQVFRNLHEWEVEETLTAVDLMECACLRNIPGVSGVEPLLLLFRCRLSFAFYRQFYRKHYVVATVLGDDEGLGDDGNSDDDEEFDGEYLHVDCRRDDVGGNLSGKTDNLGPNSAWSAYASQFPLHLKQLGTSITVSRPMLFRVSEQFWHITSVKNYRSLGWVFWDKDTVEALQLGPVLTTDPSRSHLVSEITTLGTFLDGGGEEFRIVFDDEVVLSRFLTDPDLTSKSLQLFRTLREADVSEAVAEF
ncbi:hypothetical protein B0T21DRAFT_350690 [Apiosordaria backusii]|uniref:Uncharacterized protein n=1 Tax=Apiosordaria backusii TaxID=314023 RepID=A0AA40E691_9PEZI|nr:hypothetical protein B0T21DRAFT_350690 [Apiosordaria backusii]